MNNETYKDDEAYFGRQLRTIRTFLGGKRNCHSLKPKGGKGRKYHFTALFQNAGQNSSFDLHIGVSCWDTVNLSNNQTYVADAIFFAPADIIDVCLVNFLLF